MQRKPTVKYAPILDCFLLEKNWGGGGGWHEPSAFALGHENPLRSSVRAMQFLYGLMMFAL